MIRRVKLALVLAVGAGALLPTLAGAEEPHRVCERGIGPCGVVADEAETEALAEAFGYDGRPVDCSYALVAVKNPDYARWEIAPDAAASCHRNWGNGYGIAFRPVEGEPWERLFEASVNYDECAEVGMPNGAGVELGACVAHRFQLNSTSAGRAFAARVTARATFPSNEGAFCPSVEINEDRALCMAEYRLGRDWWRISGTVEAAATHAVVTVDGRKHWRRRWTVEHEGSGCTGWHVKGLVETNEDGCAAPMASDIESDERLGFPVRRTAWHGTDTEGFNSIVVYRCRHYSSGYECSNALGDAFRYLPR